VGRKLLKRTKLPRELFRDEVPSSATIYQEAGRLALEAALEDQQVDRRAAVHYTQLQQRGTNRCGGVRVGG
jgi:hypothetical protein